MCGIAGYVNKKGIIEDANVIKKMVSILKHRGPDDNGYEILPLNYNKNALAMGFTRLSILDVSQNGHQPMSDDEQKIYMTFNGEIFNAFEYKDELIKKGCKFKSNTDTEILLYLYKIYGIDEMLRRINGMFAVCIADLENNEIYLIRDRLGVKPLYYYENENAFMYSSECKTFYAHPDFKNELNEDVFEEYMIFRYVAGKNTLLKGVYNVLPGHYIKINKDGVKDFEYWQISDSKNKSASLNDYEEIIKKSVKERLLSDVKLGVQLSGGIDSSLVTLYASQFINEKLESFSVVFDEENKDYSEKKWMDIAASKCNIKQNEHVFSYDDVIKLFPSATWHLDEPLNHPNSIGIYLICIMARGGG